MTVHERVAAARLRLRASGVSPAEADFDARVLAEHLLGWDAARFFTSGSEPEPADFVSRYQPLIDRRAAHEPVAYIVGHREFWNLDLEITPAVLIPRPETEIIVVAALELFPNEDAELTVADACTGSGCLAIAIACERPRARIIATDISADALAVARRNAARHDVAARIEFVEGDLLSPVTAACDLIVANPPYVAERDRLGLQPEVGEHEPAVALFGGPKGLTLIERLVGQAPKRLRAGGYFIFEFGFGQDEEIETLVGSASDLELIDLRRDLQGIARTAVARRR